MTTETPMASYKQRLAERFDIDPSKIVEFILKDGDYSNMRLSNLLVVINLDEESL